MKKVNPLEQIKLCKKCKKNVKFSDVVVGQGCTDNPDILFLNGPVRKEQAIVDQSISGHESEILDTIVKDLSKALDKDVTFYVLNSFLCAPKKKRKPTLIEKLNCSKNVQLIVKHLKPKMIVFLGNEPESGFKSIYKEAVKVSHPETHAIYGSKVSPMYLTNVKKLTENFQKLTKTSR